MTMYDFMFCSYACNVLIQNYLEFHEDLFPDTHSNEPGVGASAWFQGSNGQVRGMQGQEASMHASVLNSCL